MGVVMKVTGAGAGWKVATSAVEAGVAATSWVRAPPSLQSWKT